MVRLSSLSFSVHLIGSGALEIILGLGQK